MKTIFEKIIDREIPADIVYEDDICIAFLDISPVKKGHVLLCSKKPYPWVQDVPASELADIMTIAQRIISSMRQGISADYVRVSIVGTEIPHFHIHLIPQSFADPVETSHDRHVDSYENDQEKQLFIEKISQNLHNSL
jgi:histidine triad (HIT) family protein